MQADKRTMHCGVAVAALLLAGTTSYVEAGPKFSDWSTSAGTGLQGGCPIESRDGNKLFIAGGFDGTLDIFYYERKGKAKAFDVSSRTKVGDPVSDSGASDFCPTPLPGNTLLFVSDRSGGCGGSDIYASHYNPGKDEWSEPRNLGCESDGDGPNTNGNELSPSLVKTAAGTLLYFSTGPGPGYATGQDIFESRMRMDGSFGPGMFVEELNTAGDVADRQPNVFRGGLEIVFASNRDVDGIGDIWYASRNSVFEAWSPPVNLSDTVQFDTAGADESRPTFSWDGKRLYYGSGGVYVSTRTPGN